MAKTVRKKCFKNFRFCDNGGVENGKIDKVNFLDPKTEKIKVVEEVERRKMHRVPS